MGIYGRFRKIFELIVEGQYPLSCIALPCWLDTVRWYSTSSTTTMIYRSECLLLWRVVKKLLHGKGIELLKGIKNLGQILHGEATSGTISPQSSWINFAIPEHIKSPDNIGIPDVLEPGIIDEAIQIKTKSNSSMVLSVDGKKIAPGLSEDWGDVNLFGHETPNLQLLKEERPRETKVIDTLGQAFSLPGAQKELVDAISASIFLFFFFNLLLFILT